MLSWSKLFAQPGPIKNLRYNDDFSYLQSEAIVKKGTDKLKYIPLSHKNHYVSFGGEVREWYEYRKNSNFGDLPPGSVDNKNGILQHRLMLHADFQLGDRVRTFVQLNNTLEFGNQNAPIPEIAVDGLGLHQAFVEYQFGKQKQQRKMSLRVGRQEYDFGNGLLISSREGPNNRLSFDGITLLTNTLSNNIHLLVATPVIIETGIFDNKHIKEYIWGGYANLRQIKNNRLDAYYLGFYSERRQFNYVSGINRRHTVGMRAHNHGSKFYYDVETMLQAGKFNDLKVAALNVTGEVRYIFQSAFWKPMIGIGASYITGDYDANDNQMNTFDPMYPKPVYGLAIPQGPTNISHIRPTFGFQPTDKLFFNFRYYYLARTSIQDGTYTPGMVQVRPIPNITSDKRRLGNQFALDVFYIINQHFTFLNFVSHVEAGPYPMETGAGKNVFYWASALQYKF